MLVPGTRPGPVRVRASAVADELDRGGRWVWLGRATALTLLIGVGVFLRAATYHR